VRHDQPAVLRRLAPGLPDRLPERLARVLGQPVLLPGLRRQDRLLVRHDRHREGVHPPLPLRPADAAGLEDLPAVRPGRRGRGRRLARVRSGRMTRLVVLSALLLAATALSACTVPTYEAEPVSVYQWERRQQAIERELAERERLCRITKDEDPRKAE